MYVSSRFSGFHQITAGQSNTQVLNMAVLHTPSSHASKRLRIVQLMTLDKISLAHHLPFHKLSRAGTAFIFPQDFHTYI